METNLNFESIWGNNKKITFWDRFFKTHHLQKKALSTPSMIQQNCEGLSLGNQHVKSLIFSTDMALIENNDADAVLAVYPFAPSTKLMKTLIGFSDKPVVCGVGGGTTKGKKSIEMAMFAQDSGASGVIVNIPFENRDLERMRKSISIPIVASIASSEKSVIQNRINSGVDVFHVTGGKNTSEIVKGISSLFPYVSIMATGGNNFGSIEASINSGANAIVLSPPSNKDLFKSVMEKYRKGVKLFRF
ncbi:beta/alpha barrel domain-containing protein [Moheibacter sediminis]|uniref:Hydrolase n=1 Tax=Moheibacter sediminis TaxID=1434700 RepID=A0A1W2AJI2_9FLAO|nr:hypothetical protein [Moheibacter sediminis]SMC60720.1 hypothetical protein SAMN06296427_104217 [Moheibacter sediminis]